MVSSIDCSTSQSQDHLARGGDGKLK